MALNFKSNATALDSLYATYQDVGLGGNQLFMSGFGTSGQIGNNARINISSPAQIGSGDWKSVSRMFSTSLAIKNNGTLWSWGAFTYGSLGLSNSTYRSSPVQVGSNTNWSLLFTGAYHVVATKTDGTLWAWGRNNNGQLGQNDRTDRSSPIQIGSGTDWSLIAAGRYNTFAIKTNGTLWSWGLNSYGGTGLLGLNDTTPRSSPVQVGSNTNWSKVFAGSNASFATKTDGTLWSWGRDRITSNYSSPVQVGTNTNWLQVAAGYAGFVVARKTDGTLWSWGTNGSRFYLGQGSNDSYLVTSSPGQIGTNTNWNKIHAGAYHSLATKTDGTLWGWGRNSDGQLGQNNYAYGVSSPIQVGTLTNWHDVSTGGSLASGLAAIVTYPYQQIP